MHQWLDFQELDEPSPRLPLSFMSCRLTATSDRLREAWPVRGAGGQLTDSGDGACTPVKFTTLKPLLVAQPAAMAAAFWSIANVSVTCFAEKPGTFDFGPNAALTAVNTR